MANSQYWRLFKGRHCLRVLALPDILQGRKVAFMVTMIMKVRINIHIDNTFDNSLFDRSMDWLHQYYNRATSSITQLLDQEPKRNRHQNFWQERANFEASIGSLRKAFETKELFSGLQLDVGWRNISCILECASATVLRPNIQERLYS